MSTETQSKQVVVFGFTYPQDRIDAVLIAGEWFDVASGGPLTLDDDNFAFGLLDDDGLSYFVVGNIAHIQAVRLRA